MSYTSDWVPLSSVARLQSGGTPSKSNPAFWAGDLPWVSAKDMKSAYLSKTEDYVIPGVSGVHVAPRDAILMLVRGMTLQKDVPTCYLTREMAFNQDIKAVLAGPNIDTKYLFYALLERKPLLLSLVEQSSHGTGKLNTSQLQELEIRVPPVAEQRAIAGVLGALDDKIELNRQMNRTLEGIARALFRAWFVDFAPVRAKARGETPPDLPPAIAALFPDHLVDSPLGEIPAGWEVGTISAVADNVRQGVDPASVPPGTRYVGLEHVPRQTIALEEFGASTAVDSNKSQFAAGDVLFGKLRPYFHKVVGAPFDGICSTDILVLRAKKPQLKAFVLMWASSTDLVNFADQRSAGTKMPRTNWNDVGSFPIARPREEVLRAFEDIAAPMVKRIEANLEESRTLAALRDGLLPRLISGELRVGEVAAASAD